MTTKNEAERRQRRKAYFRRYYLENKEAVAKKNAERYQIKKPERRAKVKAWQAANVDRIRAIQREYRRRHADKIRAYNKKRNAIRTYRVIKRSTPAEVAARLLAKATQAARRGCSGTLRPGGM